MVLGLGKSKEEKQFEKEMDVQEPYKEMDDEAIARDMSLKDVPNYPSNIVPEDYFQYKRFVNLPESQAVFTGKIDKDVVFANLGGSKPSLEELRFQIGTIELFEGEFVEERDVFLRDKDGNVLYEELDDKSQVPLMRKLLVFDESFRSCLNFLMAEFKFAVVASRALSGSGGAANLDVSSHQRITKEFNKRKEQQGRTWGTGG